MSNDTDRLVNCLEEADLLISTLGAKDEPEPLLVHDFISDDYQKLAPIEKLAYLAERNRLPELEPVRIIQHLSCTGGSLFAKCIAAMPNIVLLSEISPLSTMLLANGNPRFLPTDIISLSRQAKAPSIDELSMKVFLAELHVLESHLQEYGQRLVLREHSHSSFLTGKESKPEKTVRNILAGTSRDNSIVTVRHPFDSYLSLKQNKWIDFDPNTFDEYCKRYLSFMNHNSNVPVFKYENLTEDPKAVIQAICGCLDIPYNEDFLDYLEIIAVTGDSGRRSYFIENRERKPFSKNLRREAQASQNFNRLCELLDYEGV